MSLRQLFLGYAIFLFLMGFIAFALSGFDPKAKTAMISGTMAALSMGLAFGLIRGGFKRLGAVLGLIFVLLFCGVFTWRSSLALMEHGTESWKPYKPVAIGLLQMGSVFTAGATVAILSLRNRRK